MSSHKESINNQEDSEEKKDFELKLEKLKSAHRAQVNKLKSYYETIIGMLPGHVYWQDTNNVFLGCNNIQAEQAGLRSREQIKGKTNYDMPWKDQADALNLINNKVMHTGEIITWEEYAKMKSGEGVYLSQKMPLRNKRNKIIGVVGISIDITERKKMESDLLIAKEKAEASSRAKTEFIANMSHDIRTPLAGMVGLTDILEQKIHDPEDKECIQYLKNASQQLLNLLNGVLDVVSADNNQDEVKLSEFSCRETISGIEQLFLPALTEKNIKLAINIDSSVPKKITTDETKIERIILNLMSNAIKFSKAEGCITINAKCLNAENKNFLELSVKDNGIGIPQDQQNKIFDGFYKVNPSYEGVYRGHGVGLYIVKKFLDLLGGKINVNSTFGKGTEFVCTIPFVLTEAGDNVENKTNSSMNEGESLKKSAINVLIVEDDAIVFFVEKRLLQDAGCDIDRAVTGKEALELAQKNQYDFILMDIGLPDISGIEVTQQLRQIKKLQDLPIIGLTAHAALDVKLTCLEAGMSDVLTKPLLKNQIETILQSLVKSTI